MNPSFSADVSMLEVEKLTLRQNQMDGTIVVKATFSPLLNTTAVATPKSASGIADSIRMAEAIVYLARWGASRTVESRRRS